MEDGVTHDGVHIWCCEVGFREYQYVQSVVFHVFDQSVHLGTLSEACGVPASNVKLVFGWNFDVMLGSVGGARVEYMGFEPVGSGVGFVVGVML